ncbi:MAG: acyl-CoA dehydrogenase family protein [Nitrospirae bacterium]|nr:acyl-CoA dehydrogenase family protein [Nitrospirota bacterium]
MVDCTLTPEEAAIRDAAKDFAERSIRPLVTDHEARRAFPQDLAREMGRLGLFGCALPKTYGGTEAGFTAHALVTEEISRVWSSLRHLFNTQALTCPMTILHHGTEAQKTTYVPKLVMGEWMGFFALTEPHAGSDVAATRTRATRRGNRYILNGTKAWISNATVFDAGLVLARTDDRERYGGLTLFVVDRSCPGITAREYREKLGHHASPTGEIIFDNCEVPEENRIGPEGTGFRIVMESLDRGRLSVAAGALGVLRACLEAGVDYARSREAFGKPIGRFQMVQERIAEMAVLEQATRLLVLDHAARLQRGEPATMSGAIAKYHASEAVVKVANWAVEIFGSYGYSEEYPVARLFRDAKMYQIGEGTSNIQRIVIAERTLGFKT